MIRHIHVTREDDFAVVTLDRPERRNALSEAHLRELLDAVRDIGDSDARGLILTSRGPDFCSGHDVQELQDCDEAGVRAVLDTCRAVMETLQSVPQPVVAEVQGLATAAGCQLVASCDLAVAGESARFAAPGGRGAWFCHTPGVALARAIGRKRALEMLLTGDAIDAQTAAAWGLVNRVVRDDLVAAESRALLVRATRGCAASKAAGKRSFYAQVELDSRAAYDRTSRVMVETSQTAAASEARRGFLARRRSQPGEPR